MSYFSSASAVYETLGRLVTDIVHSNGLGGRLRETNSVVQLSLSEPAATITAVVRGDQEPRVEFGSTSLTPTVKLTMSADTAHGLFLGTVGLVGAVGSGDIKVEGPGARVMPQFAAIEFAAPRRYAHVLELAGHSEVAGA